MIKTGEKRRGFTLIELAIAIVIIGVIVGILITSFGSLLKTSRNTKRKSDIDTLKYALELYRTSTSHYPLTLNELLMPTPFIQRLPQDPLSSLGYTYQYEPHPVGCTNNDPTTYCVDFTLGSRLEDTHTCTSAPATSCYQSFPCNYCLGPYGEFTN